MVEQKELLEMLFRIADAEFGFGSWPTEEEITTLLLKAGITRQDQIDGFTKWKSKQTQAG